MQRTDMDRSRNIRIFILLSGNIELLKLHLTAIPLPLYTDR